MFGTNIMFSNKGDFLRKLKTDSIDFFSRKNLELFIFITLVSFSDLFFAITDDTCVDLDIGVDKSILNNMDFEINLKKYLLGYATIFLIGYFSMIFSSTFYNSIDNPMSICSGIFFNFMSSTSLLIYNTIGGLIFWTLVSDSECSDIMCFYMSLSLCIKYVFYFINWFNNIENTNYDKDLIVDVKRYKVHYN